MAQRPTQDAFDDPTMPPRLARDLSGLYRPRIDVPAEVDQAVLAQARKRLVFAAGIESRRPSVLRRIGPWAAVAAAACLALAVFLIGSSMLRRASTSPNRSGAPAPLAAREDIDRSGQVDILDAFALARRLDAAARNQGQLDRQWDVNGDGQVDQRDVDAIANRAVALEPATAGGARL